MQHETRLRILEMLLQGIPSETILREDGDATSETSRHVLQSSTDLRMASRRLESTKEHDAWMSSVYRELQADVSSVDSASGISASSFFEDYYSENRPLLLNDALDCKALSEIWELEGTSLNLGEAAVPVVKASNQPMCSMRESRRSKATLTEVVSGLHAGGQVGDEMSPLLRTFRLVMSGEVYAASLTALFENNCAAGSLWYAAQDVFTAFHYREKNVMLMPLHGRVSVTLVQPHEECCMYHDPDDRTSPFDASDPDSETFPLYRYAHPIRVEVPAGSAVFIPVGWWHSMKIMSGSLMLLRCDFLAANYFPANFF